MTDSELREETVALFSRTFVNKFNRGAKEHGGSLLDRPVLAEAWNELLDLAAYIAALKEQHQMVKKAITNARDLKYSADETFELIEEILHI